MKWARAWLIGLTGWLALAATSWAAQTQARLVLAAETARPGETVMAGVQLRMAPRWHTYWRNGGDAGEATKIQWSLPPGVSAGSILWPVPDKLTVAGLTTYVYDKEVVLLVPLTLSSNLPPGPLPLKANVSWLECEEMCLPGKAPVNATLNVGDQSKPSADAALLQSWRNKLPKEGAGLAARAWWEKGTNDDARPLVIEWSSPVNASAGSDFFPYGSRNFEVGGETKRLPPANGKLRLQTTVKKLEGDWPKQLEGLIVEKAGADAATGYEVRLPITAAPAAEMGIIALPAGSESLWAMLGLAFLGGLILNIMPCVLPVIALKLLSFVNQCKEAPQRVRMLGTGYGIGVVVSFLALAGIAIAAQQAGGTANWGMALQNQIFRVLLTVIITLVALNLFGVFEITLGGRVIGAAGELAAKEGMTGALLNGVLATILATPCTAPFLTVAVAFAFTQPPLVTLLVFLAAGLGLAAPFVLLSWQPAWLKLLPKPGAWMEKFKVAMGFPMLATAIWLFWFTAPRYGRSGVLWLGLFLVVVAAAAWIWGEFVQRGLHRRGLALGISLTLVAGGYFGILEEQLHWRSQAHAGLAQNFLKESANGIDWQPWSPEAVKEARAQGRPVLVDFTADNCLNCQVNKRTSLEIPNTRAKLKEINAVALLGDFSDNDPRIAAELRRYGRAGVPLVLVYPKEPQAPPIILPTILTPGTVLAALNQAGR